jgi:hypothetical protein
MDFLDLFALLLPLGVPDPSSPGRTPEQSLTAAVGLGLLPVLLFVVVLFAGLWRHPVVALGVLPLAFAVATGALGRVLATGTGWTLAVALGCAVVSALAGGIALMLAAFASFFSGF